MKRLSSVSVIAIFALGLLSACEGVTIRGVLTGNPAPTSVQISTDHALVATTFDSNAAILSSAPAAVNDSVAPVPPPVATGPVAVPAALIQSTPSPSIQSSLMSFPSAFPTPNNSHLPFTAHISVSSTFPDSVSLSQRACTFLQPFLYWLGASCDLNGFDLTSSLVHSGGLQIQAQNTASPSAVLNSNVIPSLGFRLRRVEDFRAGVNDNALTLGTMNGRVYFSALNASGFAKVYSTDGTDLKQVTDLNPAGSDNPSGGQFVLNNRFYFAASAGTGTKLFSTDGTDLKQHSDLNPGATDQVVLMYASSTRVYFNALDPSGHIKLFSTNGSDLKQNTDTNVGGDDSATALSFAEVNGRVFFVSYATGGWNKYYSTDGSDLVQITDTNPGSGDVPLKLGVMNGRLYFFAIINAVDSVFSTNGFDLIRHTEDGMSVTSTASAVLNGRLYYVKTSGIASKLFSTDGTDSVQTVDIRPGADDSIGSSLYVYHSRLYFTAYNSSGTGTKLYSTDGTTVRQHTDFNPGGPDGVSIVALGLDRLWFTARDASGYTRLYSTDGSNVRQHAALVATGNDAYRFFTVVGNRMFFAASTVLNNQYKIFSTDGLDLQRHSDLYSGNNDLRPSGIGIPVPLTNGTRYFFVGSHAAGVYKLYSLGQE